MEEYSPRWQAAVVALADRVFGAGYFRRPSEVAAKPGATMLLCQERDRELVGFVGGQVLPAGALEDYLEAKVTDVPYGVAEADAKGVLGAIQTLAIAPGHRRKRIGTRLLTAAHDSLVGQGADKLIVTFKRGPSAASVEGIMGRLDFELWTRLPSYWKPACDRGDFHCVDRGETCTCSAVLYHKPVY